MLPRAELERLAVACSEIGASAAEPDGFVPLRNLLRLFDAELVIRPLLVEAMLVSRGSRWLVLLDSERSGVTQAMVERENSLSPLPVRARNSIVHELVHALAFRRTAEGMVWRESLGDAQDSPEWVKAVEHATERLSPLLLIPEARLAAELGRRDATMSLADVKSLQRTFGVSREVLIHRLCLLKQHDALSLLARDALLDVGIGVGTFAAAGAPELHGWPLFLNFDRNIIPNVLIELQRQRRVHLTEVFPDTSGVAGASETPAKLSTAASTHRVADVEMMALRLEVERVAASPGRRFLFVVRRPKDDWPEERRLRAAKIYAARTATRARTI